MGTGMGPGWGPAAPTDPPRGRGWKGEEDPGGTTAHPRGCEHRPRTPAQLEHGDHCYSHSWIPVIMGVSFTPTAGSWGALSHPQLDHGGHRHTHNWTVVARTPMGATRTPGVATETSIVAIRTSMGAVRMPRWQPGPQGWQPEPQGGSRDPQDGNQDPWVGKQDPQGGPHDPWVSVGPLGATAPHRGCCGGHGEALAATRCHRTPPCEIQLHKSRPWWLLLLN